MQKWSDAVTTTTETVKTCAHPRALIDDPRVLEDPSLQDQVFSHPRFDELPPALALLSKQLAFLKEGQSRGLVVSSDQRKSYQDGMSAKRAGRLSIAFEYVLDEVLKKAKKSAKEIAEHGEYITEKVRNKGVVLPDYVMKLLQSMKSAADKS